jgi:dTMP kinase
MARGHLIVFEGVDGSGTTTQSRALREAFVSRGLPAHVTAQPSDGPVGMLIRQVLSGRIVLRGSKPPGWTTMALLFAADRHDHQEAEIEPNLRDGVNVVCDRFTYSSVIYQSLNTSDERAEKWIRELNRYIRKPDLVFYLRVSQRVAEERRRGRSGGEGIYDGSEFQDRLVESYEGIEEMFPGHRIVALNGERSADEIAQTVWRHVEELRSEGAPA